METDAAIRRRLPCCESGSVTRRRVREPAARILMASMKGRLSEAGGGGRGDVGLPACDNCRDNASGYRGESDADMAVAEGVDDVGAA